MKVAEGKARKECVLEVFFGVYRRFATYICCLLLRNAKLRDVALGNDAFASGRAALRSKSHMISSGSQPLPTFPFPLDSRYA